jgi:hypothetical protein
VKKNGKRFVILSLGAHSPVGSEGDPAEEGVDGDAEGAAGAGFGAWTGAVAVHVAVAVVIQIALNCPRFAEGLTVLVLYSLALRIPITH